MSAGALGWIGAWLRGQLPSAKTAARAAETTGGSSSHEPVVVYIAPNHMEAQIVKGRLESEDIPVILRYEAMGPTMGFDPGRLGEVRLLVPEPLAEKARSLLAGDAQEPDSADENDSEA